MSLCKLNLLSIYRFRLSIQTSIERSYSSSGGFLWKTMDSNPFIVIVIVRKFQKVLTKKDSSRLSKWCLSVTKVLIPLMRTKTSYLTLTEKNLFQLSVIWLVALKCGHSQDSTVFLFYWFLSIIICVFFYNYRLYYFQQCGNWKSFSCRGRIDWETLDNNSFIKILIVRIFQIVVVKNASSL